MGMQELLIAGLVLIAVLGIGGALVLLSATRGRTLRDRLSLADRSQEGASSRYGNMSGALGRLGTMVSGVGPSRSLKEKLAFAGFHGSSAASVYLGTKLLLLVVGLLGTVAMCWFMPWLAQLTMGYKIAIVVGVSYLFFFLPNMIVQGLYVKRCRNIRRHLPDAIDLLEICVASGMGLDMAWNLVGEEIRHLSPALADEIALTNLEIQLGAPRAEAMRHMARRTGASDMATLVGVLVQSERFGTSIAKALQTFASSMRQEQSSQIEEIAEKAAVKLLFPMVLFIFPSVLVVLAGPAAIRLMEIMRH